jgi:hypothetical protein
LNSTFVLGSKPADICNQGRLITINNINISHPFVFHEVLRRMGSSNTEQALELLQQDVADDSKGQE